jgi:hypothetical protein
MTVNIPILFTPHYIRDTIVPAMKAFNGASQLARANSNTTNVGFLQSKEAICTLDGAWLRDVSYYSTAGSGSLLEV